MGLEQQLLSDEKMLPAPAAMLHSMDGSYDVDIRIVPEIPTDDNPHILSLSVDGQKHALYTRDDMLVEYDSILSRGCSAVKGPLAERVAQVLVNIAIGNKRRVQLEGDLYLRRCILASKGNYRLEINRGGELVIFNKRKGERTRELDGLYLQKTNGTGIHATVMESKIDRIQHGEATISRLQRTLWTPLKKVIPGITRLSYILCARKAAFVNLGPGYFNRAVTDIAFGLSQYNVGFAVYPIELDKIGLDVGEAHIRSLFNPEDFGGFIPLEARVPAAVRALQGRMNLFTYTDRRPSQEVESRAA